MANSKARLANKSTVFVGLSGGVDSAVSAAMLKKSGYEVVGVFIKTWHPEFLVCNEEEERRDAMRVAAFLDIPFLTFDFEDVYKKEVADYMISEYKAGRTPNPDVMCNKEVKFGAFLKKALAMGADFVATGHYARVVQTREIPNPKQQFTIKNLKFQKGVSDLDICVLNLLVGNDKSKDQSYFLWTLKQEQLKHILFPVGHLPKTEVRKLAKKFNLPVADKKDSQGICFLGKVDLKEFLKHYIKEKKGKVINEKGEEIGFHDGVVFHTLGERHGFTITQKSPDDGRYYITAKDIKRNTLTVSQNLNLNYSGILENIGIEKVNWISGVPARNKNYTSQIRYHGELLSCKINIKPNDEAEVVFDKPTRVAPGQSIVVYDKDVCLGGGVVK